MCIEVILNHHKNTVFIDDYLANILNITFIDEQPMYHIFYSHTVSNYYKQQQ